ncbi:hypothetical protein JXA47_03595 [Candidatus Sumerlaeota bacterium]|nr:hypothetical protein [Candidatus Sumerlaeota bacterium]
MPVSERSLNWKMIGAVAFLVGALVFVFAQWRSTLPPDPTDARPGRDRVAAQDRQRPRQISDEERAQRREEQQRRQEEMFQQLNLTEEQRAQIAALPPVDRQASQEARQARRQAMAEILTAEQMEQMRELRGQRAPRPEGDGTQPRRPRGGPQAPTDQP